MAVIRIVPASAPTPGSSASRNGTGHLARRLAASARLGADRSLREQLILTRETSLVHGAYREIGLGRAGLLPFNA